MTDMFCNLFTKNTLKKLLSLSFILVAFTACSNSKKGVIARENRGLWVEEQDRQAIQDIELANVNGDNVYWACQQFATDNNNISFQIEALKLSKNGTVTFVYANEFGILDDNNDVFGRVNRDGVLILSDGVEITAPGSSLSDVFVDFEPDGAMVMYTETPSVFTDQIIQQDISVSYQVSYEMLENYNLLLQGVCAN